AVGARRAVAPARPARHIDSVAAALVRLDQHGVRLPHAGGGAEEDLELGARRALLFRPESRQQLIGARAIAHFSLSLASLALPWIAFPPAIRDANGMPAPGPGRHDLDAFLMPGPGFLTPF